MAPDCCGDFLNGLGRGIKDGVVDSYQGIKSLVTDPGGAVDGLVSAVSNLGDTYDAVSDTYDKVTNGSAGDRGEILGKTLLAVGTALLGDKELSKLKVLGKLAKGDDLLNGGSRLPDSRIIEGLAEIGRHSFVVFNSNPFSGGSQRSSSQTYKSFVTQPRLQPENFPSLTTKRLI